MEPLAFVEIVDRHADVLARHAVYHWPARIGRGYDADIVVDDPYVAALHVAVEPAEANRFAVSNLGTLNGLSVGPGARRTETAEVGPDDLVRIGHTQIRIRPRNYAVAPERPMRAIALYRRPLAFALLAALTLAMLFWNGWVRTNDDETRYAFISPVLGVAFAVAVWISLWSFVSSAVGRGANFAAHGSVACAGLLMLIGADTLAEYFEFALDQGWLAYATIVLAAVIIAYMLFRHLLLNSRARRGRMMLVAAAVSALIFAGAAALNYIIDPDEGAQRYSTSIKPPTFLLVGGVTLDTFMDDAQSLKARVDALNRK